MGEQKWSGPQDHVYLPFSRGLLAQHHTAYPSYSRCLATGRAGRQTHSAKGLKAWPGWEVDRRGVWFPRESEAFSSFSESWEQHFLPNPEKDWFPETQRERKSYLLSPALHCKEGRRKRKRGRGWVLVCPTPCALPSCPDPAHRSTGCCQAVPGLRARL